MKHQPPLETKMTPGEMLADERPIKWVAWANGDALLQVGDREVTAIVAYGEPGQCAFVPWLAIYRGEEIWQRIDAQGKEIGYAK